MKIGGIVILGLVLLVGIGIGAGIVWSQSGNSSMSFGSGAKPAFDPTPVDVVCTGRVHAAGPVVPILPKVAGPIISMLAKEGATVQRGATLLFEIDDTPYRNKKEMALANLEKAKVAIEAAEMEKKQLALGILGKKKLIEVATLRTEQARKTLQELRANLSNAQMGVTEYQIKIAEINVNQALALEAAEQQELAALEATNPELKVREASAARDAATVLVREADQAIADCKVMAPISGTILRTEGSVGMQTAPTVPLPPVIIAPEGPVLVRAELEQEFLGRVSPGMKVTFRDEARTDSPTWEGKIVSVSRWVAPPRSFILEPGIFNDIRTAEIVVEPAPGPKNDSLLIGLRVQVRIAKGP